MSRERALQQIVSLKRLAEDMSTTEHERQAARDAMAKLRKKYDIPEATHQAGQRPKTSTTGSSTWFGDVIRDFNAQDQARRKAESAERLRKAREEAQRRWQARYADTDAMGVPLSDEDLKEAQRDPLAWAAKQDKRTHNQKQQDMNNAWGFQNRPRVHFRCDPMATFFDQGGIARKRNGQNANCKACDFSLYPGDGGWSAEVGGWVCTEKVPGPRKKKERQEE